LGSRGAVPKGARVFSFVAIEKNRKGLIKKDLNISFKGYK
jgi:hypothetical protein